MNGLQSLMAPRPQRPQQTDPRAAAAMDIVKNDIPEPLRRVVSENEFAQKAMELLQSAGGQAAMNKPPAAPPTVAQRVDQRAAEGVAGLLQRLAPGMQQRGQQIQRAQARQMLGGGLPTQAAPNMARMAGGGIVGYQTGGGVENTNPRIPVAGQTQNPSPAYLDPEVAAFLQELAELNRQKDAAFPQEKDLFDQKISDLISTTSPRVRRIASDAKFAMPVKPNKGMATGGEIKGYAGPEGSTVGIGSAYIDPETGEPLSRMDRLAKILGFDRSQQSTGGQMSRTRGRPTIERGESEEPVARPTETAEISRAGILNNLLRPRIPADRNFRMQGVSDVPPAPPTTTEPPTIRERMASSIEELLSSMNEPRDTTRPEIDSRLEGLRDPIIAAVTERMAPGYEESVRSRIQQEAETAYAVPQEYKDLIEARKKELETPLYTPEETRSRKIDALLAGLASSNLIAQGGPRAAAGINAVTDAIKKDELDRANKRFELSVGLMDKDIAGAQAAFGEGLKAMNTAMNQTSVAVQMAGSMLNQADNAAAARELQDRQERLDAINSTISALGVLGQLERADIDAMTASQRAATTELSSIQRQLNALVPNLPFAQEEAMPALQAQIDALKLQEAAARRIIQAVNAKLGLETGGGTEQSLVGGGPDLPSGFIED